MFCEILLLVYVNIIERLDENIVFESKEKFGDRRRSNCFEEKVEFKFGKEKCNLFEEEGKGISFSIKFVFFFGKFV